MTSCSGSVLVTAPFQPTLVGIEQCSLNRSEIGPDESVTASLRIRNGGGKDAIVGVETKLSGNVVASKRGITVKAGRSTDVSIEIDDPPAGEHEVVFEFSEVRAARESARLPEPQPEPRPGRR